MPTGASRTNRLEGRSGAYLGRLALFGWAAPRGFVDVHALRRRFTRHELETFAAAKIEGFSLTVLREAFGVLGSLPRSSFEVGDDTFGEMTTEFDSWRAELDAVHFLTLS
jgi:hypothetical protein